MASATSFALMMTATCILGIAIQGAQAGINALSATFYPTAIRSTGVGWALGVGRVGSIVGPMVAGVLLAREWTPPQIFLAGSIPALIAGLAVVASHFLVRNAGAYSVNTPIRSAETAR
jgi:AAHS family 4-hydroxybenzoate transporter-like MFS transporter